MVTLGGVAVREGRREGGEVKEKIFTDNFEGGRWKGRGRGAWGKWRKRGRRGKKMGREREWGKMEAEGRGRERGRGRGDSKGGKEIYIKERERIGMELFYRNLKIGPPSKVSSPRFLNEEGAFLRTYAHLFMLQYMLLC